MSWSIKAKVIDFTTTGMMTVEFSEIIETSGSLNESFKGLIENDINLEYFPVDVYEGKQAFLWVL